MKRWFLVAAAVLVLIAAAVFVCFSMAETRDYTEKNFEDYYDQDLEFSLGGSIDADDIGKYRIVYSRWFGEEQLALVEELRDVIAEHTGHQLEIYPEYYGKREDSVTIAKHEILIEATSRHESGYLRELTWDHGGRCAVIGKKLVLSLGIYGDYASTMQHLIDIVGENLSSGAKEVFSAADAFEDTTNAYVQNLILNGMPITDYSIVNIASPGDYCYEQELEVSKLLQNRLADLCGHVLPIRHEDEPIENKPGEIIVNIFPSLDRAFDELFGNISGDGGSHGSDTYTAFGSTGMVYLSGNSTYCAMEAVQALFDQLTPTAPTDTHEAVFVGSTDSVVYAPNLSLAYYNMGYQFADIEPIKQDIYEALPDVFLLTGASTVYADPYENEFDEYYEEVNFGYWGNLHYCADRFIAVDEGQIAIPEDVYGEDRLSGYYVILKDRMTGEKTVFFESEIRENTLECLLDTLTYLRYYDKRMVFFHHTSTDLLTAVCDDLHRISDNPRFNTMLTDDYTISLVEDISAAVNEKQTTVIPEWNNGAVAYRFDLQYEGIDLEEP